MPLLSVEIALRYMWYTINFSKMHRDIPWLSMRARACVSLLSVQIVVCYAISITVFYVMCCIALYWVVIWRVRSTLHQSELLFIPTLSIPNIDFVFRMCTLITMFSRSYRPNFVFELYKSNKNVTHICALINSLLSVAPSSHTSVTVKTCKRWKHRITCLSAFHFI